MTPNVTIRSYTTDQYYLDKIFYSNFYRLKKVEPGNLNSVAIDIGAHCGYFSLTAMSAGYKKCYAFEPFSENYKILNKNTEVFSGAIITYQAAILNGNGFSTLSKPDFNEIHFLDYGNLQHGVEGEVIIDIPLHKALDIIVTENEVSLIKINTGYAFDFVSGNEQSLSKVKSICFELPYSREELGYMKDKLVKLGFSNNLVIELKEKDRFFGFLAFFSKDNLENTFDIEDLKTKNYEN